MTTMKKLVIFDLDGTLVNTTKSLCYFMNEALKIHGFDQISEEQTKKYVGNGAYNFALRACRSEEKANELCQTFKSLYNNDVTKFATPYDKIKDLLKELKRARIKTAVLSNKPHQATKELCDKLFGSDAFDIVLGHKEDAPLKPDPSGVEYILSSLNIAKEDALFVGDGETDADTAKNCNIDFIAVLWGFRDKKTLKSHGATRFAKAPDDLINFILYYYGRKKMKKFFADFKKFISKGNVLDMAVGVIIGSAFSAIVNSLVKDIITPVISIVTGGTDLTELKAILKPEVLNDLGEVVTPAITLNYGTFIQAIINFLIIAITVFVFVKVVVGIQKTLDVNANMKAAIQKKLDADEELSAIEAKWMARMEKRDPANLPKKTVVVPPAPAEPSSTDKLLMQILEELKKDN